MPAQQSKRDLLIPDSEKREAIRLMALADDTFFNAVCKLFPKVARVHTAAHHGDSGSCCEES